MMKAIFAKFVGASRPVKAVLTLLLANIVIFTIKTYLFGLKGYYMIQLGVSFTLLFIVVVFYVLNKSNVNLYSKFVSMHGSFFKKISPNSYLYCITQVKHL